MNATLGLLVFFTLTAAAPTEEVEESYFLISVRGRTIGKAVERLETVTEDGKKLLRLTVVEHYRFSTGDRPAAESSLRREMLMTPDWTPVSATQSKSGNDEERSVRFETGQAVFKLPGGRARTEPYKGAAVAELNGRALAARGLLAVEKRLTAAVPDLAQGGLVVMRAEVIGKRAVEGREGEIFLVQIKNVDGAVAWDLLVDGDGRLLELSSGDMTRRRVAASEAVLPDRPAALGGGAVHLQGAPERFWKLKKLTVELKLPEAARGLVPEIAGQKVAEVGRRVTVTLRARRPDGSLPPEELSDRDRARWLVPDDDPDWRDPGVRKLAAEITADADGELRKGYLIGRWVYRNLIKSLTGEPEASAATALAAGAGDCSEHAALFAALCRAAGLPARTAYGLAGARGALRFHVWSEYYAGGRWIPLDAAMGRFGLPACYLTLSYDRTDGGARLFKLYAAASGRVIEAEEARPAAEPAP